MNKRNIMIEHVIKLQKELSEKERKWFEEFKRKEKLITERIRHERRIS
jgi:hypothetical protein